MNQRDLSEKLDELAGRLDEAVECDDPNWFRQVREVAAELRKLSNENYAPGNSMTWDEVKPKKAKPQGGFIQGGKRTPF